jgi:hypothetical protein
MDAAPSPAASPSAPPDLRVARPRWLVTYTAVLVVLDGTAMAAATLAAKISWLGIDPEPLLVRSFSIPYTALTLATVPTWLVLLALAGAYDLGPFASDSDDWTRVIRAGAQLLAVIAVSYYIVHLALLGRGVLAGTVPLAVILTLGARTLAQLGLGELRRRGLARRTALVIGSHDGVDAFVRRVASRPTAEVTVVGVSVIGTGDPVPARHDVGRAAGVSVSAGGPQHDRNGSGANGSNGNGSGADGPGANRPGAEGPGVNGPRAIGLGANGRSTIGTGADEADAAVAGAGAAHVAPTGPQPHPLVVSDALARTRAETLIVTGGLAQGQLRDIAWMLQGTGVELLVIPTPADIEGLRTEIRPVAGLPLLYLDR